MGRVNQIAQFDASLGLPPDDYGRAFIFSISGQGGVGKTTLVHRFREHAQERHGAVTVSVNEVEDGLLPTMKAMARQLAEVGFDADSFFANYLRYEQRIAELEADPDTHSFAALLGKGAGRTSARMVERIPGVGEAIAFLGFDEKVFLEHAGELGSRFAAFLARKVTDRDDRRLLMKPVNVLTPLLLDAVRRAATRQTVALFFDTYEQTGTYLDEWLRTLVDPTALFGDLPDNIIITVSGRDQLDRNLWAPFEEIIARIELEPFSEDEARGSFPREESREKRP